MATESAAISRGPFWKRLKRGQIITMIVIFAALVRAWAAWQLPVDADEPTYSRAGQTYAQAIRGGDFAGVINYSDNKEHPALVKLVYSIPYLLVEPKFGSIVELYINRSISVIFGTLAVLVLSLFSPLAGFFLAFDSMTIKYTSEVYLEALPLAGMLLSLIAFAQVQEKGKSWRWGWVSAVALGIAVAGKYLYGLAIIPLIMMWFSHRKGGWKEAGIFIVIALGAFWILDPYLWIDPINRLAGSLFFHVRYTQGADVLRADYPWYQVLNWLTMSVPWHAQVFFFPTLDVPITFLAVVGLWREVQNRRWNAVWIVVGVILLLAWPTKWPQYTLVIKPALCLGAVTGLSFVIEKFRDFESTWHWAENVLPQPTKLFWIVLVGFGVITAGLNIGTQINLAISRRGWTTVRTEYSPLPSNTVFALAVMADQRILIGTDSGLAAWRPSSSSPWGNSPLRFTPTNSGLAGWKVYAIQPYGQGAWIATDGGLVFWDGNQGWKVSSISNILSENIPVNAIAIDGDRSVWIATGKGAAMLNLSDQKWQVYHQANSGLPDDSVFSIAVQPGIAAWFGTLKGVTRYDLKTTQWKTTDLSQFGSTWGGVVGLTVDPGGQVLASTLGAGLNIWDGSQWQGYRIGNSSIPQNNVGFAVPDKKGNLWLGLSYSTSPGGLIARYDGKNWISYGSWNSGFSGSEPCALTFDSNGRVWIASRLDGLQIFEAGK